MKIIFYNHTGQVSGAERLLLMILSRLDRSSFEPVVVCPDEGPLEAMVTELGVAVETVVALEARFTWRVDLLARYLASFFQVIRSLRRKVIGVQPDLIHANSIRAGLVATAATFGLRTCVVWHLHDLLPRHPLSVAIRMFGFVFRRTRMIAVSKAVADNFSGRFLPWGNRVNVILNAIDLTKFHEGHTANGLRQELQLSEANPVIGIVGQLTPRKGQLELLHAFARALAEVPAAILLIVGAPLFNRDQEYRQLLNETASKLGISERVKMLGARNDVPAVMRALDFLVINSSAEPFGLVALEAMACGTPVLAAISGGIPELIEHGRNGFLVSRRDEATLASAIIALSRQPELRAQFAERGRNLIADRFSAERYLADVEAFYRATSNARSSLTEQDVINARPDSAKLFVEQEFKA